MTTRRRGSGVPLLTQLSTLGEAELRELTVAQIIAKALKKAKERTRKLG